MAPILVTGATGNVGRAVVDVLVAAGVPVRRALHDGSTDRATSGQAEDVVFDFTRAATWAPAFDGVRSMLLVRPPALGNVRRDLIPALRAARDAGVQHVVFLSLQGAETNPLVPHATVESWLRRSGMDWTFVRASFFFQNLSTTHASDIRDRDEICVPAGARATAFVDALDVAAVAAAALLDPDGHRDTAWTVTGPHALSYTEVAEVLSRVLERPVTYARPGLLRYARHARRTLGMPGAMVLVTSAIYTAARLGLAAGLTDDVRTVLGRAPIDLETFVRRERTVWIPSPAGAPA
ncbi:MAG TPA: NmrA family NAD(P)-binding protein [Actinotalea sp.]|nr:NmrA family NAD(P)-binding protein [Actinotalea sp.]